MRTRDGWLGVALLCALFVPTVLAGDEMTEEVDGRLVAVDASSGARGAFRIAVSRRTHGSAETIAMHASRLGAALDASGRRPVYDVVLTSESTSTMADFGAARLSRDGEAQFRFDSRFDPYPGGVTTVKAFGGGTFELRRDGAAVLRGAIPRFTGLGEKGNDASRAFFHGSSRLAATIDGGGGRGRIDARAWSGKNRGEQRVRVTIERLGTLGSPFAVVAIALGGAQTTLGSIATRGDSGAGSLELSTRKGDAIPGGGVVGLSGERIEVRNSAGTVVLTGTFPTVP